MALRVSTFRAAALVAAGALILHQLRYAIALGGHPGHDAVAHGHGYLGAATLAVAALGALALTSAVWRFATGRAAGRRPSPRRLWLACSLALLALHLGQESLEALATGGSAGLTTLVAHGGWATAPLALLLGGLIALGLGGAAAGAPAVCQRAPAPVQGAAPRWLGADDTTRIRHRPLRSTLGARAPPIASV